MTTYDIHTNTNTFVDNSKHRKTIILDNAAPVVWEIAYVYDAKAEKRKDFYKRINAALGNC